MNKIQKERLAVLEEATRRMGEDDYNELPFADTDALVRLLKEEAYWRRELQPTFMLEFIAEEEKEDAINKNIEIDKKNQKIKDTYLKPLEFKIKVLELEMILFNGMFELSQMTEEILEKVYPKND